MKEGILRASMVGGVFRFTFFFLILFLSHLHAQTEAPVWRDAYVSEEAGDVSGPSGELLKSSLPLPQADRVMVGMGHFLDYAKRQYQEVFHGDDEAFLLAVRQSQIYWVVGEGLPQGRTPKSTDVQLFALETNGLSDLTRSRYEMTLVEEVVKDVDATGRTTKRHVKSVAIKYAPVESNLTAEELEQRGVRVLFYNAWDDKWPRINPRAHEPDVYHSRILFNTKRNILLLDMKDGQIAAGGFFEQEPLIKGGQLNLKSWWQVFKKAKYIRPTWTNLATGVASATVQSALSYMAFQNFGNPDASFNLTASAITWVYVATLCTFGKTYGNLVKNKNLAAEVGMRFLLGLPLSMGLGIVNHAPFHLAATWASIFFISIGDKLASAIYSFIPLAREENGATVGKKAFGFANQAITEREFTAWVRMSIQQFALANDTNPHAEFRHLGNVVVWTSAVLLYPIDLWYAKANARRFPKMKSEVARLKTWVNPMSYFGGTIRRGANLCGAVLNFLTPRSLAAVRVKPNDPNSGRP